MRRLLLLTTALLLTGCTSGLIGGGRPTTITCKGKGTITGPMIGTIVADCGAHDHFDFTINVQ